MISSPEVSQFWEFKILKNPKKIIVKINLILNYFLISILSSEYNLQHLVFT